MHVFCLPLYLLIMYFIGSLDVNKILNNKYCKRLYKLCLNIHEKIENKMFSIKDRKIFFIKDITDVVNYAKCLFAVLFSKIFINNDNNFVSLVAIAVNLGYYFPFLKKNISRYNNILLIIATGCILDYITGVSMILAYIIAVKKSHHKTVASISSVLIGMIKVLFHIVFFSKQDYIEAVYFIYFGCFIMIKHKKIAGFLFDRTFMKKKQKDIKNTNEKTKIKFFSKVLCSSNKNKWFNKCNDADNAIQDLKNNHLNKINNNLVMKKYKNKNHTGKIVRKESNYTNKYKRLKNYDIVNSQQWN